MSARQLVDLIKLGNGNLRIKRLPGKDIRAEIKDIAGDERTNTFSKFWELLEHQFTNSDWEILPELDYLKIGALTSSIILTDTAVRDENTDELKDITKVYWYPDYAVKDELAELLKHGYVDFEGAVCEEGEA